MQQESPREGVGVFRLNMRVCVISERKGFLVCPLYLQEAGERA